jgi:hypothetical protein
LEKVVSNIDGGQAEGALRCWMELEALVCTHGFQYGEGKRKINT